MVSGLVTSPWDQDRIFSGLARRILIASKSGTTRPMSTFGRIGIIRLIRSSALQCFVLISSTSRHRLCSSRIRTLNDSGRPGVNTVSPLTMAS